MSSKKLFILEGQKTEKQIIENLYDVLGKEVGQDVLCYYCDNIYSLYKQIVDDDFSDYLDMVQLLKEREKNKPSTIRVLDEAEVSDFAEIFLFFDYDGHDNRASNQHVSEMLDLFNNETDLGKLYVSYPMVEALKHFTTAEEFNFKNLAFPIAKNIDYAEAQKNYNARGLIKADVPETEKRPVTYKEIVQCNADNKYSNFTNYTLEIWKELNTIHLKKANYVVSGKFELYQEMIDQLSIFEGQLDNYISDNCVAVLSAFPLFLFDYYGCAEMIKKDLLQ